MLGSRFLIWVLAVFSVASALEIKNNFDTIRSWEFVARFAFLQESETNTQSIALDSSSMISSTEDPFEYTNVKKGVGYYKINFPLYTKHKLVIYDSLDLWTEIQDEGLSCPEILQNASVIIDLTKQQVYSTYVEGESVVYQNQATSSTSAQGMFWFPEVTEAVARWGIVLLANCDSDQNACSSSSQCQGPVIADVKMSLYNGMSDAEPDQLGFDDSSMVGLSFMFFFLQFAVAFIALNTRLMLQELKKYHLTVKLLIWSIFIQFLGSILSLSFWTSYSRTGTPPIALLTLVRYCQALSNYCIILLIIMLAKGWTIVRATLSPGGALKIVAYSTAYLCFTIFAETYAYGTYDVSKSGIFFYRTPAGLLILLLRCCLAFVWFLYAIQVTLTNFDSKKGFYNKFAWVFGLWLSIPAFFVLLTLAQNSFYWTVYTHVWESTLILVAQILLLVMYNPHASVWNHTFPFNQTHLPELGSWPWSVLPNIKHFKSRGDVANGGAGHVLSNNGNNVNLRNLSIGEVYQDIRDTSVGLIGVSKKLLPAVDMFKDILDDWDAEMDMHEEDIAHED